MLTQVRADNELLV